jgi:alpha-aminoadipate carrier protein LysW
MICTDCSEEFDIPKDIVEGEIIDCPNCGLEYQYRDGKLSPLTIEGEDWGE